MFVACAVTDDEAVETDSVSTRTCPPRQHPQAAAIPCRLSSRGGIHVLLITTGSGQWGIPKGYVEADEDDHEAAAREALEEAGVAGTVLRPRLGQFHYERCGHEHRVNVFVMRVDDTFDRWSERKARRRAWVTLREAQRLVARAELRQLLRRINAAMLTETRSLRRAV